MLSTQEHYKMCLFLDFAMVKTKLWLKQIHEIEKILGLKKPQVKNVPYLW